MVDAPAFRAAAVSGASLALDEAGLATTPNSAMPMGRRRAADAKIKAAGLMIVAPDGCALFLQRSQNGDHAGEWCWPGGALEGDEEPLQAALRETREETGWIPPLDKSSEGDPEKVDARESDEGVDFTTFRLKAGNPFIPQLDKEHIGWAWAPLHAPPQPLHPGVATTLSEVLEAQDAAESGATRALLRSTIKYHPDKTVGGERAIDKSFARGGAGKTLRESPQARRHNTTTVDVDPAKLRALPARKQADVISLLARIKKARDPKRAERLRNQLDAIAGDAEPKPAAKVSKLEAQYIDGPVREKPCEACAMFTPPNVCSKVEDGISPKGHCKFWDARQAEDDAKWDESKHPRGQPGNAGQFGSGGGGEKSEAAKPAEQIQKKPGTPGLVAQGLSAADDVKKQWAKESPIKTIDDLFVGANENQHALGSVCDAIRDDVDHGAKFKNPGVKGRPRVEEKVRDGKPPGRINDVVRGGFIVHDPVQSDEIVKKLAEKFETADEGWATTPAGYFDRKVIVRFPNGQCGEVQLWHPELLKVKSEKGHKLYEQERSLPLDDPRRAELSLAMKQIYDEARNKLGPKWCPPVCPEGKDAAMDALPGLIYGSIDGDPFVWMPGQAWVLIDGKWLRRDDAEVGMEGRVLSEADFRKRFKDLPPLPNEPSSRQASDDAIALDRASVREVDQDGRLHVEITNISKANVCPYLGKEIPGYEEMGLDPERIYKLLRHPDELARATATFNNQPLLSQHVPVFAADYAEQAKKFVVGATGSDAVFEPPYLRNSLVVWDGAAISAIKSGEQRELSCGYHYEPDMTPGIHDGEKYDGVMRNIVGNHVALVREGRAGPDVVVGDSKEQVLMKTKTKLTRQGAIATCVLASYLRPRLAQDETINLLPIFGDVTAENFGGRKGELLRKIEKACRGKIAADATIGEVAELLDMIDSHGAALEEDDELPKELEKPVHEVGEKFAEPDVMDADQLSAVEAFLKDKLDPADLHQVLEMLSGESDDEEEPEEEHGHEKRGEERLEALGAQDDPESEQERHDNAHEWRRGSRLDKPATDRRRRGAYDHPPHFKGSPKAGGRMAGDTVTRTEMEEAMRATADSVKKSQRDIREAERFVAPWVGQLAVTFDSAEEVYRKALKMMGKSGIDKVHPSALRFLIEQEPLPGARRTPTQNARVAADTAATSSFNERFPDAARIRLT